MTVTINGTGTIAGITSGGLGSNPIITQPELVSGVAGNGPAFSATLSANQTGISSNTSTKLAFNTEQFDTANCYNTSTYRFTPNVAGYYQVNASANMAGTNVSYMNCAIWKNGTIYIGGSDQSNGTGECNSFSVVLVYMNGTTDYLEAYGLGITGSGTVTVYQSSSTRFTACLVRAA